RVRVNRNRGDKNVALNVALENLGRVAHPDGRRSGIINDNIPLPAFQSVELAVAIADQLFDFLGQFARMRFAPVENRDLVSALEGVTNLERASEAGAAENQNAHRLCLLFVSAGGRTNS